MLHIDDNSITQLEDAHRSNSKLIQRLPAHCHTPATLATIGWLSIDAYIGILKIMFVFRILCLPADNIYRRVMDVRLRSLLNNPVLFAKEAKIGPVKSALIYFRKYGLCDLLRNFMITPHEVLPFTIKKYVKNVIMKAEENRWKATCLLYPGLNMYLQSVKSINVFIWWNLLKVFPHLSRQVAAVMAALMNAQPKGTFCNMYNNCTLCNTRIIEMPVHVVIECTKLRDIRDIYMGLVRAEMPAGMIIEFDSMTNRDKCQFLLSGLRCQSLHDEWNGLLAGISRMVLKLYSRRRTLFDEAGRQTLT